VQTPAPGRTKHRNTPERSSLVLAMAPYTWPRHGSAKRSGLKSRGWLHAEKRVEQGGVGEATPNVKMGAALRELGLALTRRGGYGSSGSGRGSMEALAMGARQSLEHAKLGTVLSYCSSTVSRELAVIQGVSVYTIWKSHFMQSRSTRISTMVRIEKTGLNIPNCQSGGPSSDETASFV
jgi:hypothetical protein